QEEDVYKPSFAENQRAHEPRGEESGGGYPDSQASTLSPSPASLLRRGLVRALRQLDGAQPHALGVAPDQHQAAARGRGDDQGAERRALLLHSGRLAALLDPHPVRAVAPRKDEHEILPDADDLLDAAVRTQRAE